MVSWKLLVMVGVLPWAVVAGCAEAEEVIGAGGSGAAGDAGSADEQGGAGGSSGGQPNNYGGAAGSCDAPTPICAERYEEQQTRTSCAGFAPRLLMGQCGQHYGWQCQGGVYSESCLYDLDGNLVHWQRCDDTPIPGCGPNAYCRSGGISSPPQCDLDPPSTFQDAGTADASAPDASAPDASGADAG